MKIVYNFFSSNVALLVLFIVFSQQVFAQEMYKWVDEKGNVTYQSDPPPGDAANVEKSDIAVTDEAGAAADAVELPTIEFYSKIDCPNCDNARNYLEDQGLTFDEIVIEADTVGADEMKEEFGHINVPTIKIGETSLSGYSEKTLARVLKNSGFDISTQEEAEQ